ncbi:MAG: sigma-54-dependent Fis family transcriptional regulator [Candidatus Fermentibacteraceae bacterium]|nr:sigma-54-dependent Fis family transcriptional regulator [Candidatus Fermentibacteraceae bacterium]MBN2608153.1 sigma-54-dependent Fis family transcriptional regulator [Candidatus Fermentibacteraceae bacterium]
MNGNNSKKSRILVIDDEEDITGLLRETLQLSGYYCDTAASGEDGLRKLRRKTGYDLLITDLRLPDVSGLEILEMVSKKYPFIPVIVITGFATIESTKTALRMGAVDYIPKPFTTNTVISAVRRALHTSMGRTRDRSTRKIVYQSGIMDQVIGLVNRVAKTDSTILITGESGTGKELVARAIHSNSLRATQPFISVNSGALPEGLLESELFGHVKGAFTGATATTHGRFQVADGGTLFLDEVGNMSLAMQVKLLRVLQDGEFAPVGSSKVLTTDVRLIAATNMNLEEAMSRNEFREDLYYRLNVIEVHIPPLRQRTDDILPLSEYFLSRLTGHENRSRCILSSSAASLLLSYHWPGNVRELENTMERAWVLCEEGLIQPEDLPDRMRPDSQRPPETRRDGEGLSLNALLENIEKHYIVNALKRSGGNRTRAARLLGLKRTTLLARMVSLGIPGETGRDI